MPSQAWYPKVVLDLVDIEDDLRCSGHTKDLDVHGNKKKCNQQINKKKLPEVTEIIRFMALRDPASYDFEKKLKLLASILLCAKSKHNQGRQHVVMVAKWQHAIAEHNRRGGDMVMGEASDTTERLGGENRI